MLSEDQIAFYRENGYLVVEEVFPADAVAELGRVTAEFVEASRAVAASDGLYDLSPSHSAERPAVRRPP